MNKRVVLLSVFVPLFLLLLSYKLVVAFAPATPPQQETIDYLYSSVPLTLNYTALEASHLEDVKSIMLFVDIAFYWLALLVLITLSRIYKKKNYLKEYLRSAGFFGLGIIGMILSFLVFSFEQGFVIFHQIFFPQGNWQFPYDSLLIQTFPLEYFMSLGYWIFGVSLFLSITLIIVGYFLPQDETNTD